MAIKVGLGIKKDSKEEKEVTKLKSKIKEIEASKADMLEKSNMLIAEKEKLQEELAKEKENNKILQEELAKLKK